MSWTMRAAFATDDGKNFMGRHFGDARYFTVYDIDRHGSTFVKRVDNSVDVVEEGHADPAKAGGIMNLLLKNGVNTVVARTFGPNIVRIRKKVVCIKVDSGSILESLSLISGNFDLARAAWEKGESRQHLSLSAGNS